MEDVNICKIIAQQTKDGHDKVLGTGCLTRRPESPKLKIVTSKDILNIILKNKDSVTFMAKFTHESDTQDLVLELRDEELFLKQSEIGKLSHFKSCDGILESSSLDSSEFTVNSLKVYIRTKTVQADNVVVGRVHLSKDDPKLCKSTLLEEHKQGIDDLAVEGSPILYFRDGQCESVWGIVEALLSECSKDTKCLQLQFSCLNAGCCIHRQETQPPMSHGQSGLSSGRGLHMQETHGQSGLSSGCGLHMQETHGQSGLSSGDELEKLWEDQYFKDAISNPLDVEYSSLGKNIQNWLHLAQKFGIPNEVREEIAVAVGCPTSPSEALFDYLRTTKPRFKVNELYTKLKKAKLYQVCRKFDKLSEEGKLQLSDHLSVLTDRYPEVMEKIIIKLDSDDQWKKLAKKMEFSKEKFESFQRDPSVNPTRKLFDILRTQRPKLTVSVLKTYLKQLKQNEILEHASMQKIEENTLLKDLPSEAALMCDVIEPRFNSTKDNLLYMLAEKFQKDKHLSQDTDINDFRTSECKGSPTCKVID